MSGCGGINEAHMELPQDYATMYPVNVWSTSINVCMPLN